MSVEKQIKNFFSKREPLHQLVTEGSSLEKYITADIITHSHSEKELVKIENDIKKLTKVVNFLDHELLSYENAYNQILPIIEKEKSKLSKTTKSYLNVDYSYQYFVTQKKNFETAINIAKEKLNQKKQGPEDNLNFKSTKFLDLLKVIEDETNKALEFSKVQQLKRIQNLLFTINQNITNYSDQEKIELFNRMFVLIYAHFSREYDLKNPIKFHQKMNFALRIFYELNNFLGKLYQEESKIVDRPHSKLYELYQFLETTVAPITEPLKIYQEYNDRKGFSEQTIFEENYKLIINSEGGVCCLENVPADSFKFANGVEFPFMKNQDGEIIRAHSSSFLGIIRLKMDSSLIDQLNFVKNTSIFEAAMAINQLVEKNVNLTECKCKININDKEFNNVIEFLNYAKEQKLVLPSVENTQVNVIKVKNLANELTSIQTKLNNKSLSIEDFHEVLVKKDLTENQQLFTKQFNQFYSEFILRDAAALAKLSREIYLSIKPDDVLALRVDSKTPDSSFLQSPKFINTLAQHVVEVILQSKVRTLAYKQWIDIAITAWQHYNDFSVLTAIQAAFNDSALYRLRPENSEFDAVTREHLLALSNITSSQTSYANYRKAYNDSYDSFVPYPGILSTDATFIKEGNEKLLAAIPLAADIKAKLYTVAGNKLAVFMDVSQQLLKESAEISNYNDSLYKKIKERPLTIDFDKKAYEKSLTIKSKDATIEELNEISATDINRYFVINEQINEIPENVVTTKQRMITHYEKQGQEFFTAKLSKFIQEITNTLLTPAAELTVDSHPFRLATRQIKVMYDAWKSLVDANYSNPEYEKLKSLLELVNSYLNLIKSESLLNNPKTDNVEERENFEKLINSNLPVDPSFEKIRIIIEQRINKIKEQNLALAELVNNKLLSEDATEKVSQLLVSGAFFPKDFDCIQVALQNKAPISIIKSLLAKGFLAKAPLKKELINLHGEEYFVELLCLKLAGFNNPEIYKDNEHLLEAVVEKSIKENNISLIENLLRKGIKFSKDIILLAVNHNCTVEWVKLFYNYGYSLNNIDHDQNGILHIAATNKNRKLFYDLLASPFIEIFKKNAEGKTAIAIANKNIQPQQEKIESLAIFRTQIFTLIQNQFLRNLLEKNSNFSTENINEEWILEINACLAAENLNKDKLAKLLNQVNVVLEKNAFNQLTFEIVKARSIKGMKLIQKFLQLDISPVSTLLQQARKFLNDFEAKDFLGEDIDLSLFDAFMLAFPSLTDELGIAKAGNPDQKIINAVSKFMSKNKGIETMPIKSICQVANIISTINSIRMDFSRITTKCTQVNTEKEAYHQLQLNLITEKDNYEKNKLNHELTGLIQLVIQNGLFFPDEEMIKLQNTCYQLNVITQECINDFKDYQPERIIVDKSINFEENYKTQLYQLNDATYYNFFQKILYSVSEENKEKEIINNLTEKFNALKLNRMNLFSLQNENSLLSLISGKDTEGSVSNFYKDKLKKVSFERFHALAKDRANLLEETIQLIEKNSELKILITQKNKESKELVTKVSINQLFNKKFNIKHDSLSIIKNEICLLTDLKKERDASQKLSELSKKELIEQVFHDIYFNFDCIQQCIPDALLKDVKQFSIDIKKFSNDGLNILHYQALFSELKNRFEKLKHYTNNIEAYLNLLKEFKNQGIAELEYYESMILILQSSYAKLYDKDMFGDNGYIAAALRAVAEIKENDLPIELQKSFSNLMRTINIDSVINKITLADKNKISQFIKTDFNVSMINDGIDTVNQNLKKRLSQYKFWLENSNEKLQISNKIINQKLSLLSSIFSTHTDEQLALLNGTLAQKLAVSNKNIAKQLAELDHFEHEIKDIQKQLYLEYSDEAIATHNIENSEIWMVKRKRFNSAINGILQTIETEKSKFLEAKNNVASQFQWLYDQYTAKTQLAVIDDFIKNCKEKKTEIFKLLLISKNNNQVLAEVRQAILDLEKLIETCFTWQLNLPTNMDMVSSAKQKDYKRNSHVIDAIFHQLSEVANEFMELKQQLIEKDIPLIPAINPIIEEKAHKEIKFFPTQSKININDKKLEPLDIEEGAEKKSESILQVFKKLVR